VAEATPCKSLFLCRIFCVPASDISGKGSA
jgi:hypothetical protein